MATDNPSPLNPWLANAVVLAGFLVMMAASFSLYWWWTGGGDRMVAAVHRAPTPSISTTTPTTDPGPDPAMTSAVAASHVERWDDYRRRLADGGTVDPIPLYLADLDEESATIRLAAVRALAPLDDPRARAALEQVSQQDLDADVRRAALTPSP